MSLNSDKEIMGVGGITTGGAQQAPRLAAGGIGYSAWRPNMDVFLQRNGAEGIHQKPMVEAKWLEMSTRSEAWAAEALDAAMALVLGDGSGGDGGDGATSSSSSALATPALSVEMKAGRLLVSANVERSRKVFGTLYSALPEELRSQTGHIAPGWAYGLWHWLETKFQSTEEDSVGELLGRWSSLRQDDGQSFDAYRAKVNKLASLLEHAKEKPSARMYAHTLLDRLLPRYKAAVLALKAGGQLKDATAIVWDTITAFINAHERDEARIGGGDDDGHSKVMGAWSKLHGAWNKPSAASSGPAAGPAAVAAPSSYAPAQRGPRSLADVQCFNCTQFGHLSRNCPEPRKQRNNAGPAAGGASGNKKPWGGANVNGEPKAQHKASAVLGTNKFAVLGQLTEKSRQWNCAFTAKAVAAGDTVKIGTSPAAVSESVESSAPITSHKARRVRRARRVARKKLVAAASADKPLADFSWGMDSMASLHVSGNRTLFTSGMRECSPVPIQVADGSFVTATHIGDVQLTVVTVKGETVTLPIEGVHFHERFSANLLSWNVLGDKGWEFHSTKKGTFVLTPGRRHKVMLNTRGGVSVIDSKDSRNCVFSLGARVSANATSLIRLHETLGHMGFDRMMRLLKAGSTLDLPKIDAADAEIQEARQLVLDCKSCIQGKGTRTDFGHRGVDKGQGPGEVLHMDTFQVTMEREGRHWLEYGLTVTDAFTSYRWFKSLDSKDQAADAVITIVLNAQTQLGCKVKRLYADGGTEFVNRTLRSHLTARGIELHFPPARTQQLNGVAENAVRSVKDGTRSMMIHSWAPNRFWSWASKHATFVWNRTHVSANTGATPCEVLFGKKPSVKHWGVFGCDAFCHVPKEQRGVFEPKMDRCIYLGHDPIQNCGSVYVLRTKKTIQTRDLSFRPTSFTHCAALTAGEARVEELLGQAVDEAAPESLDGAAPQGGLVENVEAAAAAGEEFVVERILAERKHRSLGHQYLVKWDNQETTWEPAAMMEEDTPLLVQQFREANPVDSGPRRSKRNKPRVEEAKEDVEAKEPEAKVTVEVAAAQPEEKERDPEDSDSDAPVAAQVHMALSALRRLQSLTEQSGDLVSAVSSGVALLDRQTPENFREARESPDAARWMAAMEKEMEACADKRVWVEVKRADLPRGANILPVKWVFKIKTDETGAVTEHKARITPKGFRQKEGRDYFEVYARTGMYKSMRLGLSLAAKWDHELDQLDVPTAFLNADVDEDIYMEIPDGFRDGKEDAVCKLQKALYGLKQSPRNWYLLVSKFIVDELGFRASVSDPCLFFRRSGSGRLMLLFLFVDDFQVSYHREDKAEWDVLKSQLVARFNTKDMGQSTWILGMRIVRNRVARTVTLDQELYVTKALEKYGLVECKVAETPEAVGASSQQLNEEPLSPAEHQRYMEIVGTLMYAAISTRPDTAHAVHYLASHMLAPTQLHMAAAERVLRYLAGTKAVGLVFGSRNGAAAMGDSRGHGERQQLDVCAFADADWANNRNDRKSITGWVAKLNGDPISWSSKKQRTVALSTCEAELYAEAAAIQEVLWLRGLMKELRLQSNTGSVVHGDNQSAIAVTKNGIRSDRTKHVDIKYHFVTESVEQGEVQLKWVPTKEQQADIFTKALAAPVFLQFRRQLMTQ
jgi:transposase InsO family protein